MEEDAEEGKEDAEDAEEDAGESVDSEAANQSGRQPDGTQRRKRQTIARCDENAQRSARFKSKLMCFIFYQANLRGLGFNKGLSGFINLSILLKWGLVSKNPIGLDASNFKENKNSTEHIYDHM